MSSSGLIYAVIVGAWAAYLVPMWLRRQDELNESRPTERFSTAIRLLAGRSAMERRAARALDDQHRDETSDPAPEDSPEPEASAASPEPEPPAAPEPVSEAAPAAAEPEPERPSPVRAARRDRHHQDEHRQSAERRARLLARRRRMVTLLFVAFALGAVVAAVAGIAFIWVPAVPAVLLTTYIGHLRRLERQRFEVKLDRTRAAQAAERLRARERERQPAPVATEPAPAVAADSGAEPTRPHLRLATEPEGYTESPAAAVADATEHEEWVDGMRERAAAGPDSWEPVPVPLPTYVTAPVAPRVTRNLDLGAPGTWDSGRQPADRNTPLFDQYADPAPQPAVDDYATRPRAANE